jgi:hypothetical protein
MYLQKGGFSTSGGSIVMVLIENKYYFVANITSSSSLNIPKWKS